MTLHTGASARSAPGQTADRLRMDFLFLDLASCSRCRGTGRNLESALDVVSDVLAAAGVDVEVNKINVDTAAQARQLRLVTSPTIRLNGVDIALDLRESPCGCGACTDGRGESILCRDWVFRDQTYPEAPVAMIIEAILRAIYGVADQPEPKAEPYELPENLQRFFAGKGPGGAPAEGQSITGQSPCCADGADSECCASAEASCRCR